MERQLFEMECVGVVGVDSGHVEIGDVGDVQLTVPTRCGDGLYSVTAISVGGQVRGYFVNVDAREEWIVTGIEGADRPWPPAAVAKKNKSILKLEERAA